MLLKTQFQIVETSIPITEPITKFGGQPVWINTPQWPIHSPTDEKMMFQSQIVLDPALFPDSNGAIAYIFYGDEEQLSNYDFVVVLQTKENKSLNTQTEEIDFVTEATGPAIYEWIEVNGEEEKVSKEYKVVMEVWPLFERNPPFLHLKA